jgi:hypothetical protein
MKYFSITDNKEQIFVTESGRIDPANNNSLKDSEYSIIIPEIEYYCRIADNRLGRLTFRCSVLNKGDDFILKNICIHPIKKYFMNINEKEEYKLISFFLYSPEHKGFFLYSINAIRIRNEYFMKLGIITPESFANRIRAGTVHTAGILGIGMQKILRAF